MLPFKKMFFAALDNCMNLALAPLRPPSVLNNSRGEQCGVPGCPGSHEKQHRVTMGTAAPHTMRHSMPEACGDGVLVTDG